MPNLDLTINLVTYHFSLHSSMDKVIPWHQCQMQFGVTISISNHLSCYNLQEINLYYYLYLYHLLTCEMLILQLGMASALETLCGQSYGAKQYHMLGIYLQRSWIILFVCAVLLLPIFIFTTPLLKLLGQESSISSMAGIISIWFIPVIFSYVWGFTLQMYLQAQSKNVIITYLAVLTLALHFFFSWLLARKLSLGLDGIMISMIFAMWLPVIGQLGFVFFGGCPQTWTGFSFDAFKDLWPIIKLSLSSGLMLWYQYFLWPDTTYIYLIANR